MLAALVLSLALAMDATAVAAARSTAGAPRRRLLALAIAFGAFQSGMSALGYAIGAAASTAIMAWGKWIACGVLAVLGVKMIVDAIADDDETHAVDLPLPTIVILAIATSIDALGAGFTLPLIAAPIAVTIALIGIVAFALSLAGVFVGAAISKHGKAVAIAGGLALIALGVKAAIL